MNKYTAPELEIIRFESEDIITESGGFTNGGTKSDMGGTGDIIIP